MDTLIRSVKYIENQRLKDSGHHKHADYQLLYIKKGNIEITINDRKCIVNSPSVILLNPSIQHNIAHTSDDYTRYIVSINPIQAEKVLDKNIIYMLKYLHLSNDNIFNLKENETNSIEICLSNIFLEQKNTNSLKDIFKNNLLSIILVILYRKIENNIIIPSKTILEVQKYIEQNLSEDLTLVNLAQKFFLSKSYLSHSFKEQTGYNIKKYIDICRIKQSENLLVTTDNSIKKICMLCGYNDVNNFIRQFKAKISLTPLAYRKKHRNNKTN